MMLGIIPVRPTVNGITMEDIGVQKRKDIARCNEPELTLAPQSRNTPDLVKQKSDFEGVRANGLGAFHARCPIRFAHPRKCLQPVDLFLHGAIALP